MDAQKPLSPDELPDAKGVSAVLSRLDDGESVQAFRVDRIGRVFVGDRLPPGAPAGSLRGRIDETTGFLHVGESKIARSGTLVYSDGRQEWREFRSDATIAQAAESFSGVVFTHNHPPVMVTKDNVSQFQAGQVANARKDGKFLVVDEIIITRPSAIDRAQKPGGWELSIGFLTEVVRRDGVHDGKDFAFEQTLLEGNHVAGVDEGRAGPEIRLAMDSAFSIAALIEPDAPTTPPTADAEENTMDPKEKTDGAPEETPKATPEPPKAAVTDAAPDPKPVAAAAPEPAKEPRIDHAKLVRDRVSLIRAADLVLDSVDDSADDDTIRLAVIAKVEGNDAIAGHENWSPDYLRASFDGAVRSHKRRPTVDTAAQIAFMTGGRAPRKDGDAEVLDLGDIHKQYQADMRGAYLKPAAHTEPKHG